MSAAGRSGPDISVVVVTPERFASLRRTVRYLRAQTACDRLELVVVAPSKEAIDDRAPGQLDGFARVIVVEAGPIDNVDRAAARGVLRATAPVVAMIEDHAYPEPEWAEALIEAHRGPWGAVGSTMVNANPRSTLSWTNMLIAYGSCTEPAAGGERETLPGHNMSYKREPLAAYGDRLAVKLGREGGLLDELRAAGHRFYLEPRARLAHANPSRLASTAELRFDAGRLYGARRAEQAAWSAPRRLLYVAGGPLIPLVRFARVQRELFGGGRRRELVPRVLPALLLGLVLDGLGQMFGYAFGAGRAPQRLAVFEMGRPRHLTRHDRRALAG